MKPTHHNKEDEVKWAKSEFAAEHKHHQVMSALSGN